MLKEIYFRDPTDPKYNIKKVEVNSGLETVLNKIRMVLTTKKGDVLGEPDFGLDLENMLFDTTFDEGLLKSAFFGQMQKYIAESYKYNIDLTVTTGTDGISTTIYLYITVNGVPYIGIQI